MSDQDLEAVRRVADRIVGDYPDDVALTRVRARIHSVGVRAKRPQRLAYPSWLVRVVVPAFAAAAVLALGVTMAVLRPWASAAPVEAPVGGTPSPDSTVDLYVTPLRHPYVLADRFAPPWGRVHWGVDLVVPEGTPIHAVHDGIVQVAHHEDAGYGIFVQIDHGDGIEIWYAHMSDSYVVAGQRVVAGQMIGRVGSTGRATGPHLHLEVRVNGGYYDSVRFMREHGVDLEAGA